MELPHPMVGPGAAHPGWRCGPHALGAVLQIHLGARESVHSNLYSDKITHYLVCRDIYVQAVKSNGGPGREKKGSLAENEHFKDALYGQTKYMTG